MGKRDPRVDAYIARAPDFAQPILRRLRALIHSTCPEVEETIKWSVPHFVHQGILCATAGFKKHCALIIWHKSPRGANDQKAIMDLRRITNRADLPSDATLKRLLRETAKLNASGIKPRKKSKPKSKRPLEVPNDLAGALSKNKRARATFDGFSNFQKTEYVEWITEAKREETRQKRLATAIEWLAEGKTRNWKYR
jgi:uncharacterized protein YdeI (YjbR/CyaY-like superfamily)